MHVVNTQALAFDGKRSEIEISIVQYHKSPSKKAFEYFRYNQKNTSYFLTFYPDEK